VTTRELSTLYVTSKWRRAAHAFLRLHPICIRVTCAQRSTVVDHIVPRSTARDRGELQRLTWDRANWQPMCKPHHDEKTRGEQGWGRTKAGGGGPTAASLSSISPLTRASSVVTRDYSREAS
jgi:5-methylcytosine-specific restriction protein A